MAYNYGTSPVHGYATPDDETPLDATSWSHLVDGIGIGTPVVCASAQEQADYLAAVTTAGYGPSSTSIIRVMRTDLDGLVARHDGLGWQREWGGRLWRYASTIATGSAPGGSPPRNIAGVDFELPFAAYVHVRGDTVAYPPPERPWWAFQLTVHHAGTGSTQGYRRYHSGGDGLGDVGDAVPGQLDHEMLLPAGAHRLSLRATIEPGNYSIRMGNSAISVSYA